MVNPSLHGAPLPAVSVDDRYWNRYIKLIPDVVLPYQWEILNDRVPDAPPSYCIQNFRIAAGEAQGERRGTVFQDSDLAKWLEAVAYSLASTPDGELERHADDAIALVGRAQCADGYLNTYYTLVEPDGRWQNLAEGHELYCAGHFIEAGVAYWEAVGKTNLLDIVCRFADLICLVFGPGEEQLHGYPGHPEIELALIRLYRATKVEKYLGLARYFVEQRGREPNYFLEEMKREGFTHLFPEFRGYDPVYSQSHLPIRLQRTAEGHAVRATYLYCAMADLAVLYQDAELLEVCQALWENITQRRMHLTGGIGSSGFWERFTTDYDLPGNATYSETCASIGLALFGLRMSRATGDASYFDVVERALYNTVRAGISLEGDRYFYVNPLEVWPPQCMENTSLAHVKPVRQRWFDVACCPTNVARTFTALGQYIYTMTERDMYVNLFIGNRAEIPLEGGLLRLDLETDFPQKGLVRLTVSGDTSANLHIRVPSYAENSSVTLNGKQAQGSMEKGYFVLEEAISNGVVELQFDLRPRLVYANPLVRANSGKVALLRGPEVYCLEETDNEAGLAGVFVDTSAPITEEWRLDLLGGTAVVKLRGKLLLPRGETAVCDAPPIAVERELTCIPYGSWGNRKPGEMIVWLHALTD